MFNDKRLNQAQKARLDLHRSVLACFGVNFACKQKSETGLARTSTRGSSGFPIPSILEEILTI